MSNPLDRNTPLQTLNALQTYQRYYYCQYYKDVGFLFVSRMPYPEEMAVQEQDGIMQSATIGHIDPVVEPGETTFL